jgi:hypothetical protein
MHRGATNNYFQFSRPYMTLVLVLNTPAQKEIFFTIYTGIDFEPSKSLIVINFTSV